MQELEKYYRANLGNFNQNLRLWHLIYIGLVTSHEAHGEVYESWCEHSCKWATLAVNVAEKYLEAIENAKP